MNPQRVVFLPSIFLPCFQRKNHGSYCFIDTAIPLRHFFVVVSVSVCLLASCGATTTPPSDGREIADPFLELVRGSKLDDAWQSTTAEFKSFQGKEEFRKFVSQHPVLKVPLEFTGHEIIETYGLKRNQCAYRPADAKSTAKIRVLLAQEQNQWKVEALFVE